MGNWEPSLSLKQNTEPFKARTEETHQRKMILPPLLGSYRTPLLTRVPATCCPIWRPRLTIREVGRWSREGKPPLTCVCRWRGWRESFWGENSGGPLTFALFSFTWFSSLKLHSAQLVAGFVFCSIRESVRTQSKKLLSCKPVSELPGVRSNVCLQQCCYEVKILDMVLFLFFSSWML